MLCWKVAIRNFWNHEFAKIHFPVPSSGGREMWKVHLPHCLNNHVCEPRHSQKLHIYFCWKAEESNIRNPHCSISCVNLDIHENCIFCPAGTKKTHFYVPSSEGQETISSQSFHFNVPSTGGQKMWVRSVSRTAQSHLRTLKYSQKCIFCFAEK